MEEKILDLLEDICDDDTIRDNMDTNLFEEGLLDSLGFAELLVGIEEDCGIMIPISSVERTEVDTPAKIIAYAARLR